MDKGIIKPALNFPVLHQNIWFYLQEGLQKYPENIAIECFVTGRKYTYEEVMHDSACWAKAFDKYRQGETHPTIAVILSNCIEVPIVALGAARSRCPMHFFRTDFNNEIKKVMLQDSQTSIIVSEKQFMNDIQTIQDGFPDRNFRIFIYGLDQTDERSAAKILREKDPKFKEIEFAPNVEAYIFYTSGTTGLPKGIVYNHNTMVINLDYIKKAIVLKTAEDKDGKDITLTMSSHIMQAAGIMHCFSVFSVGGKAVVIRPFSLSDTLATAKLYKTSAIFVLPEAIECYSQMENACETFQNIQTMYNLGQPFHPASVNRLKQRLANSHIKIKKLLCCFRVRCDSHYSSNRGSPRNGHAPCSQCRNENC